MKEASEINEWRYETNKSSKMVRTKWTFKQGNEQKQIYILQQ